MCDLTLTQEIDRLPETNWNMSAVSVVVVKN